MQPGFQVLVSGGSQGPTLWLIRPFLEHSWFPSNRLQEAINLQNVSPQMSLLSDLLLNKPTWTGAGRDLRTHLVQTGFSDGKAEESSMRATLAPMEGGS